MRAARAAARIAGVFAVFAVACALAIICGFNLILWIAEASPTSGIIACGAIMILIVLAIGLTVWVRSRPAIDPFPREAFERGAEYKQDRPSAATEHPEEWIGPLTKGRTRVPGRLAALLRERRQLPSVRRVKRPAVGRHRPASPPALEPGTAHMPVPEPVTKPDSVPPASFAEPEPRTQYRP